MTPSDHILKRLARVSPTAAFLGALVVFLAGLFLPGIVGALLLGVLAAGLGALTFTTWPVQAPPTRVIRLILLSLLIAAVVSKLL